MLVLDKALWESMSEAEKTANVRSHHIGVVDDCYRCVDCEMGSWNTWKKFCPAREEK